jgi:GNAT superfamily N-acetyltransferase
MGRSRIRIEHCPVGPQGPSVSERDLKRLLEITLHYFPRPDVTEPMIRHHLEQSTAAVLARRDGKIIGFGAATCLTRQTPFAGRPLPVIFQRMLYLDPEARYKGIGVRLQVEILCECMGLLWPFRRFVLVCRTLSPSVAKALGKFTRVFPKYGVSVPPEVRGFAESMLPVIGSGELDERFALIDALEPFKGDDYSDIWRKYLHSGSEPHDRLLLDAMYIERDGRIINSGCCLMMIAYARPLAFLRHAFAGRGRCFARVGRELARSWRQFRRSCTEGPG